MPRIFTYIGTEPLRTRGEYGVDVEGAHTLPNDPEGLYCWDPDHGDQLICSVAQAAEAGFEEEVPEECQGEYWCTCSLCMGEGDQESFWSSEMSPEDYIRAPFNAAGLTQDYLDFEVEELLKKALAAVIRCKSNLRRGDAREGLLSLFWADSDIRFALAKIRGEDIVTE